MTARTDALIRDLGADLRPVQRLRAPWMRAVFWLALVAGFGVVLAAFADRAAIAARLAAEPDMGLAVLGSTLTAGLAALAAFELSCPDRQPRWALLPLPGLALWLGASGWGCLRSIRLPGIPMATAADTPVCFGFIVAVSIPLSLVLTLMIRQACPLRPNLTAATAGLAAAAAAATLLTLFHPYDAGLEDLAVHVLAIGAVIGANQLVGGRLLSVTGHPRAS